MTRFPQTLCQPQSPAADSTDDLVRVTLEACEQAHDACLSAVRQALRTRSSAPPLNDWLAGASLCRTLAEVLAVEAPEESTPATQAGARPRLSPWVTGMAQLCIGLCRDLASRHADEDDTSRQLRQACEGCVQACVRLLADAGPPGGCRTGIPSSNDDFAFRPGSLAALPWRQRVGLPPQSPSLAAA